MKRAWWVVVVGTLALAGGAHMGLATDELAFNPPLQQPIEVVREIDTTFFDRAVEGTPVYTIRAKQQEELVFTREKGQLQVQSRLVHSDWQENGVAAPENIFTRASTDHPLHILLDEHGQAQRVVNITEWMEPIQQSLMQLSGKSTPVGSAPVEASFLRSWNAVFGIPWTVLVGRPLELSAAVQFKGKLQSDLSPYGQRIVVIEETPVAGTVTVTQDGAPTSGILHVQYVYSSDVTLTDEARTQFLKALGNAAQALPSSPWRSAALHSTTEATVERATLMPRSLTVQQVLAVTGEGAASFREERTIKVRRAE